MDEQRPHQNANGNTETSDKTSVKDLIRRHLDHLADFQNGEKYSMMPRQVVEPWRDKRFPEAKYRVLEIMLNNADSFHVSASYLRSRFDHRTLKKYIPELVTEGVLRVDLVAIPKRGKTKVYHVNPISKWRIREVLEWQQDKARKRKGATASSGPRVPAPGVPAPGVPAPGVPAPGVPAPGVYETNLNETNLKEIKGNENSGQRYPQPPAESKYRMPKSAMVGRIAGLYDQFTKREIVEGLTEALRKLFQDRDILRVVEHYEELGKTLEWNAKHAKLWKLKIAELALEGAPPRIHNSDAPIRSHEAAAEAANAEY